MFVNFFIFSSFLNSPTITSPKVTLLRRWNFDTTLLRRCSRWSAFKTKWCWRPRRAFAAHVSRPSAGHNCRSKGTLLSGRSLWPALRTIFPTMKVERLLFRFFVCVKVFYETCMWLLLIQSQCSLEPKYFLALKFSTNFNCVFPIFSYSPGRNLTSAGSVCDGIITAMCYQTMSDGLYVLRLGGGPFGR